MSKRKTKNQRAAEAFARAYQEATGKKAKIVGKNEVEVNGGVRCRIVVQGGDEDEEIFSYR